MHLIEENGHIPIAVYSCSTEPKSVVVNMFSLEGSLVYQYLLRIYTKKVKVPTLVEAHNIPGESLFLRIRNPFVCESRFSLHSSNSKISIEPTLIDMKSQMVVPVALFFKEALRRDEKAYVFVYDGDTKLNKVFEVISQT